MTESSSNLLVKIVSDNPGSVRVRTLYHLVRQSNFLSSLTSPSKQINPKANINIISSFKDIEELRNIKFLKKERPDDLIIFDVSEDLFENNDWGPLYSILTVSVDFVICSNSFLQERIYEMTGRLAAIVNIPNFNTPIEVKEKDNNLNSYLWFGGVRDIFSILSLTKKHPEITIACDSFIHSTNTNISVFKSNKTRNKIFNSFDVFFFPETTTEEGEFERYQKAKESLYLGKIVVAPNLVYDQENIFINSSLEDFKFYSEEELVTLAKEGQRKLLEYEGKDACLSQLETAIKQAPNDDFLRLLEEHQEAMKLL